MLVNGSVHDIVGKKVKFLYVELIRRPATVLYRQGYKEFWLCVPRVDTLRRAVRERAVSGSGQFKPRETSSKFSPVPGQVVPVETLCTIEEDSRVRDS